MAIYIIFPHKLAVSLWIKPSKLLQHPEVLKSFFNIKLNNLKALNLPSSTVDIQILHYIEPFPYVFRDIR